MKYFAVLCFLADLASHVFGSPIGSKVTIDGTTIEGLPRSNTGILEFLGIPFATPPVGSLRWKPPQPVRKANGSVNATAFGASCYSAEMGAPSRGPTSEDCLFLNLWTGARDTAEKRPVMVWIYGGGFQFGSSIQPNYNGTNLAGKGVVLVSFNYRLGVLGFLALSELDSEGTNSGDFGLQDQVAALRWVKENISRFGGDPDNITVFGESAGAHSVGLLLASSLSAGLFNKAILESGAYWDSEHGSIQNFSDARSQGQQFQEKLNATSAAQLRALPAATVNNAALWNSSTDPGITAFAPSIDRYVVREVPAAVFDKGQTPNVPILAGFNADEEFLFLPRAIPHSTPGEYRQSTKVFFGRRANESLQLYPGITESQANRSANTLDGDLIIREQTFEALDSQARRSNHMVYGYYFTYTSPYSPVAAHTAEVNFVFGNLVPSPIFGTTPAPSAADFAFSNALMTYWTNFAKTGNPNNKGDDLPEWPIYQSNGTTFLELGNNITSIPNPSSKSFQFIRSLRTNGVLPLRWRNEFTND